jgi:hypothetical protein
MKQLLLLLFVEFYSLSAFSQYIPQWLYYTPTKTDTYYYRVSHATAQTEEIALKKAFATAIYESAFAIGIAVDIRELERISEDSALVSLSRYVNIPVNLVCQYAEELTTRRGYKVYVLCQVANNVKMKPEYKTFNCFLNREEE